MNTDHRAHAIRFDWPFRMQDGSAAMFRIWIRLQPNAPHWAADHAARTMDDLYHLLERPDDWPTDHMSYRDIMTMIRESMKDHNVVIADMQCVRLYKDDPMEVMIDKLAQIVTGTTPSLDQMLRAKAFVTKFIEEQTALPKGITIDKDPDGSVHLRIQPMQPQQEPHDQ